MSILSADILAKIRKLQDGSVPAIPTPPPGVDAQTRQWMEKVKESIEVRTDQRGDPLDTAVTRRELMNNGVIEFLDSRGSPITPPGLPPNPVYVPIDQNDRYNPYSDLSVPIAPAGVVVVRSPTHSLISWNKTTEQHVDTAEVWWSITNDLSTAALAGTGNQVFGHSLGIYGGVSFYYWVRFISFKGVPSPYQSLLGVEGAPGDALTDTAFKQIAVNEIYGMTGTFLSLVAEEGSISNLMIGDTIQSDNYVPGVSGWTIKK